MRVSLDYRPAASLPDSGIGRQNIALAEGLRHCPQVAELRLVSTAPLGHPLRQRLDCPDWGTAGLLGVHRLPQRLRFEAGFLPGYLRRQRIDLHICNFNMGLPLCRRARGTRFVQQLHDLFQLTERNLHDSWIKRLIYRCTDRLSILYALWRADQVWVPSQFTAGEVRRLFPRFAGKLRVLPPAIPLAPATSAPVPVALPARYWLAVGTREPRKNIALLVRTWLRARREDPLIPELLLVGHPEHLPGDLRGLPGLHFLSDIDGAMLIEVYRRAERLWQPSYAEGFGLPVIEALAVGTPVAVARGTALDEVAPPQAPRFAPHDGEELLALMRRLAREPAGERQALIDWAQRFSPQHFQRNLSTLLEELAP
ncbi:glycosyltransferase family 4 protein [Pseudomonas sp. PL-6]